MSAAKTPKNPDLLVLAQQVGQTVRALRLEQGLTQQQLAERMGWERRQVCNGEGARPQWTLAGMAKAAIALGCSISDLVRDIDLAVLSFSPKKSKRKP